MSPSSLYLVAMATKPPSTPEYEENIFFACSGGSNSKKFGSLSPIKLGLENTKIHV